MTKCILCDKNGEKRKYFRYGAICEADYIGFLEFVVEGYGSNKEAVEDSFEEYKLSLDLDPEPPKVEEEKKLHYPEPKPYNDPMKMGF